MLKYLLLANLAPQADAIDKFVETQMTQQHIPGLVLLVIKDGKTVKEKAYGLANLDNKSETKLNHRFDMGSIGKTFTAGMIMQLVEKGKLKLDQPVIQILPDFPAKWSNITVRHLLSHQSGLPDYAFMEGIGLADTYEQKVWTDKVYAANLDFPTGRLYQYSNSNFVVLGLILEKIYGKKYAEIAKQQIFEPFGMTSTGFRNSPDRLPTGSATGYFYQANQFEDAGVGGISPTPSDGGGFTSIYDLNKWRDAMVGDKFLKPSTVKQMQTPSKVASGRTTGYGLGWMTAKLEGSPQITHGGNSVGFSATLSTFPKQKLEVYMLCNLYPVGGDAFAVGLARLLEKDLQRKPIPAAQATDPQPALTEKLMAGLGELAKRNTKSELFHEDMQLRLATGRGQMSLPAYAGFATVKKSEFISKRGEAPDTVYRYRVFDAATSWIVDFQVDKNNKIYSIGRLPDLDRR